MTEVKLIGVKVKFCIEVQKDHSPKFRKEPKRNSYSSNLLLM